MKMSSVDVSAAHEIAVSGNLRAIKAALQNAGHRRTPARLLLESVASQYDAEPDRTADHFQAAFRLAATEDRPYIVDLYVPILLMQGQIKKSLALLDSVANVQGNLLALFSALREIALAMKGEPSEDFPFSEEVIVSDVCRARILQRLATAAYYRRKPEAAIDYARRAASIFTRIGSYRSSAAALSIAYNVQHAILGDIEAAYGTARDLTVAAVKSKDSSFEISGLVAQYEIAAEFGDAAEVSHLKSVINRKALPNQYRERFARGIADVLPYAWDGDFAPSGPTL